MIKNLSPISFPGLAHSANTKDPDVPDECLSGPFLKVPYLGKIAAGNPIEAIESLEEIEVPRHLLKKGFSHFVLCVQGSSMIDDEIYDGDFVVVRQQNTADDGEIVVAVLDNEATLKRLHRKQGKVELHPANIHFQPIIVESHQRFRIAGVMAGLIPRLSQQGRRDMPQLRSASHLRRHKQRIHSHSPFDHTHSERKHLK